MPTHNDGRAHFARSLRDVFERASLADTRVRVDAQAPIYANGDEDESMYLIESGQVKLSMSSASGRDCLLAIYSTGDLFGESCFTGTPKRSETATAMQPTVVRRVSRRDFLAAVRQAIAAGKTVDEAAATLPDATTPTARLAATAQPPKPPKARRRRTSPPAPTAP